MQSGKKHVERRLLHDLVRRFEEESRWKESVALDHEILIKKISVQLTERVLYRRFDVCDERLNVLIH